MSIQHDNYLNVEIGKEAEKHDGIKAHDVGDDLGEVAFNEEELRRMDENGYKLDHLHGRQVLLPPEVLLILGPHGGQQVVRVHDNMNERIKEAEESGMSSWSELDAPPNSGRHDAVMYNMQIGDLVKFFPQHKEDGIHEFRELAKEIPPTQVNDY